MLHYERIHTLEGIDVNKSGRPKECILCNYWYILDTVYIYKPEASNGCHDISLMVNELKNIAILNIKMFVIGVLYGI